MKILLIGFGDKTIPMPLMDPSLEAYSVLQDDENYKTTTIKGLEDSQKLMQNLGLNQVWEFFTLRVPMTCDNAIVIVAFRQISTLLEDYVAVVYGLRGL